MAAINYKRVALGAVAGGVAWLIWELVWSMLWATLFFDNMEDAMKLTGEPHYGAGVHYAVWFPTMFILSGMVAWLYAAAHTALGPGPKTAFLIGCSVGFAAGFPANFFVTNWLSVDRLVPLHWTVDLWVGCILAALVAGWLYKE